MKTIDLELLILFHKKIIASTGGLSGIRDEGLLRSALSRCNMTFDGVELYTSPEKKIAAIAHSLICNHGFVDGNKRIGVSVMILLCKMNNITIKYTQQEVINLGLGVASGKGDADYIYKWIMRHKI